jgi:hypothetical protein
MQGMWVVPLFIELIPKRNSTNNKELNDNERRELKALLLHCICK